ncbi:MAG: hypothetical protein M3Q68_10060 [Actinomycetota bacterium]|nr:hypothetical protein [Actinomycetota bacterium]
MNAAEVEHRLRLHAESVVSAVGHEPVLDTVRRMDGFEAATLALVGIGALTSEAGTALVTDVVDALVVRGASWLVPTLPQLDPARLYAAAAGDGRPVLRAVVPVDAALSDGRVTSAELWSDRAVARVVAADGSVAPSYLVGAAGVDDRRLELRDASGASVTVELDDGVRATDVAPLTTETSPSRYLDAVVVTAVAQVRRDPADVDVINGSRCRVQAVADALALDGAGLDSFDRCIGDLVQPAGLARLLEVVAVAQRFPGGWWVSMERWTDHWRAVVVLEAPASTLWTAVDGDGVRYGGQPLTTDVVRFDPPLPDTWAMVTLERHVAGRVVALTVER